MTREFRPAAADLAARRSSTRRAAIAVVAAAVVLAATSAAEPPPAAKPNGVAVQLPTPIGAFREAPGVELAMAQCALCHSPEYLANQPPSKRAFWRETVEKMKKNYKAPIPEALVDPLTDYLVEAYGVE